ncbi:MAG: uncharacterized protein KVP18_004829 [Porospora cf. gigantea A]|nr:MAG: hypothetical protein KVP18_004829 [Porospora cf. gigantea A]
MNFMGCEFGHPDQIDLPRPGNNFSLYYARRRWDLADDEDLKFKHLDFFDAACMHVAREIGLSNATRCQKHQHISDEWKTLAFQKGESVVAMNFHPSEEREVSLRLENTPALTTYHCVIDSEEYRFGGRGSDTNPVVTAKVDDVRESLLTVSIKPRQALVFNQQATTAPVLDITNANVFVHSLIL